MATTLETFFVTLERVGVADVLIPFILIFVIVFAVLQKSRILGSDPHDKNKPYKAANTMIGLVMGLAVVIPHVTGGYPPGADVVDIINQALPNISVVVVAIVMLLLILGIWGSGVRIARTPLSSVAVWIAIISVVATFGSAAGWFGRNLPSWLSWITDPDTQAMVVIVLVFALIIWFITREPKSEARDPNKLSLRDVILDNSDSSSKKKDE